MNAPLSADKLQAFRDLDAERAEARARSTQRGIASPQPARLTVCALGLDANSLRRFQDLAALSQCQTLHLTLLGADAAHAADVLLLNGADPTVAGWAPGQAHWLARRAVLWVGKPLGGAPHRHVKLPLPWHELPQELLKTYQAAPPVPRAVVPRRLQPEAPAVLVMAGAGAVRQQCRQWLDVLGYHATVTAQAREGLAALHAAHHRCVLLCEQVPDLDHLGLVRRVRLLERKLGPITLVYLSREDGALQRWRARLMGFDTVGRWPDSASGLKSLLDDIRTPLMAAPAASSVAAGVQH